MRGNHPNDVGAGGRVSGVGAIGSGWKTASRGGGTALRRAPAKPGDHCGPCIPEAFSASRVRAFVGDGRCHGSRCHVCHDLARQATQFVVCSHLRADQRASRDEVAAYAGDRSRNRGTRGLRVDGWVGEPLTVNLSAGSLRTLGSVAPAHDPTIRLGRDPRAKWPPGGGSHLDRDGADLPANDNRVRSPRRASGRALLAAGQRRGLGA